MGGSLLCAERGCERTAWEGVPVLGSRGALLRLCTISVIDLMLPFLNVNVS